MKSNLINYDAVPGKTARQIEAMSDKTIIRLHNKRFPTLGSFLKYKRDGGRVYWERPAKCLTEQKDKIENLLSVIYE